MLKEGIAEDYSNRDALADLLRFRSTASAREGQDVSLSDYVSRMKDGQDAIYYLLAPTPGLAASSPHLEIFAKKGIEVLLLGEEVDGWVVGSLPDFDGKRRQSVAHGEFDPGLLGEGDSGTEEEQASEETGADVAALAGQIKDALDGQAWDVRVSTRLTTSPACIMANRAELGFSFPVGREGNTGLPAQPVLEINPRHPLIGRLNANRDYLNFAGGAQVLFSQAVLTLGARLDDPATFVTQLNDLLVSLTQIPGPGK